MTERKTLLSTLYHLTALVTPLVVLGLGVAGFFWLASFRRAPAREERHKSLPVVETVPVRLHDGGLDIETDGVVVPYREIQIAAEVDGQVVYKSPLCRAGKFVRADTLLLSLDPTDYQKEVERLKAELREAEASLKELDVDLQNTQSLLEIARAELELQRKNYARMEGLFGRGVATDADLDQAKESLLTAQSNYQNLENQLRAKQTSRERLVAARDRTRSLLQKAQLDLKRTEIRAPVDGVVVQDLVEQGSFVRRGTTVVQFEDTSAVEVKCSLRVEEMAWIWAAARPNADGRTGPASPYEIPSLPASVVYTLNNRQYVWTGRLSRYEGIGMDERTRMFPCRVVVDRPTDVRLLESPDAVGPVAEPPALVRGMYVSVHIHVDPHATVFEVPERALQPGDWLGRVRDGKLRMVHVRTVDTQDDTALVLAPQDALRPTDRVVVSAMGFVVDTPLAYTADGIPIQEQRAEP